jgi:hypothetical protein
MELHVGGRVSTRGCRCYPQAYLGDHLVTGRYVADAWKVGVLLEGVLERGGIEKEIGKLMGEQEGIGMRERAMNLTEKARMCLESSGSSQQAVDKLVDHILSL